MHPLSFLAVGMGLGALFLIPLVGLEVASGQADRVRCRQLASFAYVCIFPSLLGYLFLNRGIELIGANRAAPFMHLVPVFGSVLAIVLSGRALRAFSRRRLRAGVRGDHDCDQEVTAAKPSADGLSYPEYGRVRKRGCAFEFVQRLSQLPSRTVCVAPLP